MRKSKSIIQPKKNSENQKLGAKKSLSQNFLVDKNKRDQVVRVMQKLTDKYPDRNLLEIGPGQGDITTGIVEFNREVLALEIDPRAVDLLQLYFPKDKYPKFNVLNIDANDFLFNKNDSIDGSVLKAINNTTNFTELKNKFNLENSIILANLPFHIGSRILIEIALYNPKAPISVILQREVCQKVLKSSKISFFGAFLNLFYDFKIPLEINPKCFWPQPKVWSALINGYPKVSLNPVFESHQNREKTKSFLKSLFGSPKKTIYNNLKQAGFAKEYIDKLLKDCSLDENSRLSWDNYQLIILELLETQKIL